MGRVKTTQERIQKQMDRKLASQEKSEQKETTPIRGFRTKTILRKANQMQENKLKNDLVNGKFSQLTIPQKKG